jgi:uracil-DNA glycosylase
MSLTREDMLRELELLPVWRLNAPLETPIDVPLPAEQEAATNDVLVAQPIETIIEAVAESEVEPNIETEIEAKEVANQQIAPQELEAPAPALPDVASMDWAELKQHVVGSGDQNADWVFVGEVPSDGDASTLLDKMLIAIQLQRDKNVYLTQLSEPDYFNRQIALIQPKLIIAFGEKAAQVLRGSNEPLDALRGKVHQYEGLALVASYAPSHLLEHTQDKAKAWADLCLARETMRGFNAA